jgi:hypothetical protein
VQLHLAGAATRAATGVGPRSATGAGAFDRGPAAADHGFRNDRINGGHSSELHDLSAVHRGLASGDSAGGVGPFGR